MLQQNELLTGIRVIDLSQYIPGPFATRQLSDLGADVIKVEPPLGDPLQTLFQNSNGESPVYDHLNRGKRILKLDLKSTSDSQTLRELLSDCDVLLESFRPGVLDRLGFDRDTLSALNPKLIHCAISGFGQNGPYRQTAGHDLTYCAVGGALGVSGIAERPVMSFPPVADHAGAMQAVTTILAALIGKARKQESCFIDISLYEPVLSWQYLTLLAENPKRETMQLNGGLACYNIYKTMDQRFVALAALELKFWSAFCSAAEKPAWIARHNEDLPQTALSHDVQQLFASQPLNHWLSVLAEVDCCFEPIPNTSEIATHPQLKHRQMIVGNYPAYPAWINKAAPITAQSPKTVNKSVVWLNSLQNE